MATAYNPDGPQLSWETRHRASPAHGDDGAKARPRVDCADCADCADRSITSTKFLPTCSLPLRPPNRTRWIESPSSIQVTGKLLHPLPDPHDPPALCLSPSHHNRRTKRGPDQRKPAAGSASLVCQCPSRATNCTPALRAKELVSRQVTKEAQRASPIELQPPSPHLGCVSHSA